MGNQGSTFGKRQREQNRKDKARAKQERLAARRAEVRVGKGPPIASFAEASAPITFGQAGPGVAMPPGATSSAPANREAPGDRPTNPPPGAPRRR
jgi:hypothetical protein